VDERTEVYSLRYLDAYFASLQVKRGWEETLRQSRATAAVLPADSPLAFALTQQWRWRTVGHDQGFVLLVTGA
jgi:hypothetical protein